MSMDSLGDSEKTNRVEKIKGLLNKEISLSKQPLDDVLKDERVVYLDKGIVMENVLLLADQYGAGEEEIKRAGNYEVVEVPDEIYGRLAYSDMVEDLFDKVSSVEDLVAKDMLRTSLLLLKKMENSAGVCNSDQKLIVIRKNDNKEMVKRALSHELLHAMADRDDGTSGFQKEDEESHDLNEAMVEIMEMAFTFNLTPRKLSEALVDSKIKLVDNRMRDVLPLLMLFVITSEGDNPITIKNLAKHYWSGDEEALMAIVSEKVELEKKKGLSKETSDLLALMYGKISSE